VKTVEVAQFFGLVLIMSVPFYVLGIFGVGLPFAPALPLSALMAIVPMIVALGLVWRQRGPHAATALFKCAFDLRHIPSTPWVILALLIMPAAFALTGGIVWPSSTALPTLHLLSASAMIPAFVLFFLGAVAEEIGWQGYAYPRLIPQFSALTAALLIGIVWALWHVIPFALMGRGAAWIFWQGAGMVLMRILIVWLVVKGGRSIMLAVLFHMMSNSVWGMFPDYEPWYDPMVMFAVLLVPVTAVVVVWGPATLNRFRFGLQP
jgi:uncharacterized protein